MCVQVPVERRENMQPAENFRIEWEEEKRAKLAAAKKVDEPERKKGRVRVRYRLFTYLGVR